MKGISLAKFYKDNVTFFDNLLAVLIVVSAMGFFYLHNLDGWKINDDEGSFLYQAWRVSEGDIPYRDFMTSHWPLFSYTGAGWMRFFGTEVLPVRILAVFAILGTAILVFLLAKEVVSPKEALLSMVIFLLHPQIFYYGRLYHPEPFYLFFGTAGLLFFVKGQLSRKNSYFVISGILFALATLYKQLAVLFFGGCILFLVMTVLRDRNRRSQSIRSFLTLGTSYGLLLGIVLGIIGWRIPQFYQCVVKAQFMQGNELSWTTIIIKNIGFLVQYLFLFSSLFLLAAPSIFQGWKGKGKVSLLAWQIPMMLIFLIFSRNLFARLLIYLVPSLSILFVMSISAIRKSQSCSYFYPIILAVLLIPWAMQGVKVMKRTETDTEAVVQYVQSYISENEHVLSDYQELGFYVQRPSTYSGSEISHVFTAGGVITAQDLITEMARYDVKMVLLDVHGDHMASLIDYADFRAYLQGHFRLLTVLPREWQSIEVYYRQ